MLAADGVKRLYDKVARFYDVAATPYAWSGAARLSDRALAELQLSSGDAVVDLGTGTGRNLIRLAEMVGPTGTVVGVDISPQMLARARAKVDEWGLTNVELLEDDIATYEPPPDTQAVVASYAIEMLADYDAVIARMVARLRDDGRIAVTGLRDPERWPEWLVRLASVINRPLGVTEAYRSHRPWETINRYTSNSVYERSEPLSASGTPCLDTDAIRTLHLMLEDGPRWRPAGGRHGEGDACD